MDKASDFWLFKDDTIHHFTTAQGNVNHVMSSGPPWPEEQHKTSPSEMELVTYSSNLLSELHKQMHLAFFNHL
ncbi:coiled-coil domain-containing protein 180-like [Arapaima gigas]